MKTFRHVLLGAVAAASLLSACGVGDAGAPGSPVSPYADPSSRSNPNGALPSPAITPSTGRLNVNLVDAPADDVTGVYVTLTSVQADIPDAGSAEVMSAPVTVDLLTLQNGNFLGLGSATVPAGSIDRLRLMVDANSPGYVTFADGGTMPLKVPSGSQSGIKLEGPFEIQACADTTFTLDFDGKKSLNVHGAGNSGEYILRPVVFVKQVETAAATCVPESVDAGDANAADGGAIDAVEADAGNAEPTDIDAGVAEVDAGLN